jgi:hypothetical protein
LFMGSHRSTHDLSIKRAPVLQSRSLSGRVVSSPRQCGRRQNAPSHALPMLRLRQSRHVSYVTMMCGAWCAISQNDVIIIHTRVVYPHAAEIPRNDLGSHLQTRLANHWRVTWEFFRIREIYISCLSYFDRDFKYEHYGRKINQARLEDQLYKSTESDFHLANGSQSLVNEEGEIILDAKIYNQLYSYDSIICYPALQLAVGDLLVHYWFIMEVTFHLPIIGCTNIV